MWKFTWKRFAIIAKFRGKFPHLRVRSISPISCATKRDYKTICNTSSRRIERGRGGLLRRMVRAREHSCFLHSVDLFARGCTSRIVLAWHRPSILDRWWIESTVPWRAAARSHKRGRTCGDIAYEKEIAIVYRNRSHYSARIRHLRRSSVIRDFTFRAAIVAVTRYTARSLRDARDPA